MAAEVAGRVPVRRDNGVYPMTIWRRIGFGLLCASGAASAATAASQCYAPSDPVRLTGLEQKAVVLTKAANPNVFSRDFSLRRTLATILSTTVPGKSVTDITDGEVEAFLETLLAGLRANNLT